MSKIFDKVVDDLKKDIFFSNFQFRKRGSTFLRKIPELRQTIELQHWFDYNSWCLVIFPIYGVRFDVLHKWFEKFNLMTLQDQRVLCSIGSSGNMLSIQDRFNIHTNTAEYNQDFENLKGSIIRCSEYVFSTYSSLSALYEKGIEPIFRNEIELLDVGADWIFRYLTLCKNYKTSKTVGVKKIIFAQAKKMHERGEPNIAYCYDQIEEIFDYLEKLKL